MPEDNVLPKRVREGVGHRPTRGAPTDARLETSVGLFGQRLTAELEAERQSARVTAEHQASVSAPIRKLIAQDPRAAASLEALHQLAGEAQEGLVKGVKIAAVSELAQTFSFTAGPGLQIFGPPYDLEWTSPPAGAAYGQADKNAGTINGLALNGVSSAGVGVFLSTPLSSLVRVTPFAPFTYQWSGFDHNVPAWCSGSVGVVVYIDGDPRPAFEYRTPLWQAHFSFPGQSGRGSGSSTVTRDLTRDILIPMEPGSSYQIWVWCAVSAHSHASVEEGLAGTATAQIDCQVPFIIVNAGPAVHVR